MGQRWVSRKGRSALGRMAHLEESCATDGTPATRMGRNGDSSDSQVQEGQADDDTNVDFPEKGQHTSGKQEYGNHAPYSIMPAMNLWMIGASRGLTQ